MLPQVNFQGIIERKYLFYYCYLELGTNEVGVSLFETQELNVEAANDRFL